MASVQVYQSRGRKYVRVVESYRDPVTKKPKTKTIENLGRLDLLEAENPNVLQELKEAYAQNRQHEKVSRLNYSLDFIQNVMDTHPDHHDGLPLKNYGYLLYDALWKELKLDYFFNYRQKSATNITYPTHKIAALLTYMRLLAPGSKKRSWEQAEDLFNVTLDGIALHDVYRSLGFFAQQKENLEKHLNKHLSKHMDRDVSVCFYDVTTYYFESQLADDLKRFGFSKDNKVNQVQVVMGLLIDSHGIPISYELFPGNTNEFSTLEPVLLRLKKDYGIKKLIITADRGLNSKTNLARIRRLGFDYVMAYKIRTAGKAIKEQVLDSSGYTPVNPDLSMKEAVLTQSVKLDGELIQFDDQFILTHSHKRAAKDRKDRERLVEKAVKLSQSKSTMKAELKKGGKKYVQLALEGVELDLDTNKIESDAQYDGYYGIVSSDKALSGLEVIGIYQSLWKIEESFRVMKTNLEARPIFVWTEESIQGHFVLCYLALVIQRFLEYRLKTKGLSLSTERIQSALASATLSLIESETGPTYYIKTKTHPDFQVIQEALESPAIPSMGRINQVKL